MTLCFQAVVNKVAVPPCHCLKRNDDRSHHSFCRSIHCHFLAPKVPHGCLSSCFFSKCSLTNPTTHSCHWFHCQSKRQLPVTASWLPWSSPPCWLPFNFFCDSFLGVTKEAKHPCSLEMQQKFEVEGHCGKIDQSSLLSSCCFVQVWPVLMHAVATVKIDLVLQPCCTLAQTHLRNALCANCRSGNGWTCDWPPQGTAHR